MRNGRLMGHQKNMFAVTFEARINAHGLFRTVRFALTMFKPLTRPANIKRACM